MYLSSSLRIVEPDGTALVKTFSIHDMIEDCLQLLLSVLVLGDDMLVDGVQLLLLHVIVLDDDMSDDMLVDDPQLSLFDFMLADDSSSFCSS
jgi:hypothetical protein